jgi:hypothetical protein
LIKEAIKSRFMVCRIWPLNLATMVGKFALSEVFTIVKEEGVENAYQSNATNFSNSGDKVEVAIDLLNITNIFQAIPNLAPTTSTNASEPDFF